MEISIGSANFGDYYGSYTHSKLNKVDFEDLLKLTDKAKKIHIDTAFDYPNSHNVIKEYFKNKNILLSTKINIPKLNDYKIFLQKLEFDLCDLLDHLCLPSFENLYVHNEDFFLNQESSQIFESFEKLKSDGVIKNIGASIYTTEAFDNIYQNYNIDSIQVPVNVFDQRFLNKSIINSVQDRGIKLHGRSLFLQGILLNYDHLSEHLSEQGINSQIIFDYKNFINKNFDSPFQAIICFMKSLSNVFSNLVIGFENSRQFFEVYNSYQALLNYNSTDFFSELSQSNINLIDPRTWKKK